MSSNLPAGIDRKTMDIVAFMRRKGFSVQEIELISAVADPEVVLTIRGVGPEVVELERHGIARQDLSRILEGNHVGVKDQKPIAFGGFGPSKLE